MLIMAFIMIPRFKRLLGWLGELIYCHNGDFTNFLKLVTECLARPGPRVPG